MFWGKGVFYGICLVLMVSWRRKLVFAEDHVSHQCSPCFGGEQLHIVTRPSIYNPPQGFDYNISVDFTSGRVILFTMWGTHEDTWLFGVEICFCDEKSELIWMFSCSFVLQSGLIQISGDELFITPLPEHLALEHNYSAPVGHHPHVIYKRSAERRVHGDQTSPPTANKHLHHNHHHHDHHLDYQHGRFQRQHFCGRRKQCM